MTMWRLALLAGAVTATAVAGVAVAYGGGDVGGRGDPTPTTMVAQSIEDEVDGDDPRTGLRALMQDPDFREDLWALQEQQQTAVRAWWSEYGDDPAAGEARDALEELREAHREAMRELVEEYGVEWQGVGGDGSAIRELMGDEEFRDELWALQDETGEAVQSWWDEYGDDPTSDAARAALAALREKQRAALEALGEKYGVELDGRRLMGHGGGLGERLLGGAFFGGGHGRGDRGGLDHGCGPGIPDGDAADDSPTTDTTRIL
ncbi:MAG: hypothetical protein JW767_06715 [Thermoleophilia bacterium]|nr:hypothetical protein [Thermoleophilia bacterium]